MGKWYDEESEERSRQKAAESFHKVREGFEKFADGIERDADREERWNVTLNNILADRTFFEMCDERSLDWYLLEARGRLEVLNRKGSRLGDRQASIRSIAPPKYSLLYDAISGLGTNILDDQIRKHEQLIRNIEAEKERRKKVQPQESPAEEAARKVAEGVDQLNLTLALLEERRREAVKKHPDQEDAINRRFRKAADAILEQS